MSTVDFAKAGRSGMGIGIAIYEGADGPLETAPDPRRKTMNAIDFVKAGRPGMVTGKVGKKD